jgi:glutamate 5-kinase
VLRKGGKNNIDLHSPVIGQDGEELLLKQALASIGQPELLARFSYHFNARGIVIGQVLVNHGDFEDPKRAKSTKGTIQTLLALGAVPILNGNDPTSPEGFYYDNDMITADTVVATGAKHAIMYTSVGGFMVDGQVVPKISYEERDDFANFVDDSEKSDNSSGGMESKLASINRMTDAGATVRLVGPYRDARLANIISGSYTGGTTFLPSE